MPGDIAKWHGRAREGWYHRPPGFLVCSSFFLSPFLSPPPKIRDQKPRFFAGGSGSLVADAAGALGAGGAPEPVVLAGAGGDGNPARSIGIGGGPVSLPNTPASASMKLRSSCTGHTVVGCVPLTKCSV